MLNLRPAVRGLILDMDGVLWRANEPIGNLPHLFQNIDKAAIAYTFCTNNATTSVAQYLEKLYNLGVHAKPWQIITSGMATCHLLKKKFPLGGGVYVVGEPGLIDTLSASGFFYTEVKEDTIAVVAGLDRKITYEKIARAALLIRDGIPFYGTNPDPTYPSPDGLLPGAGTIVTAVQTASGVTPILAGKPATAMFELAMERMKTTAKETLVVGDRLDTDILGGFNSGLRTALVLTGVSTREEAKNFTPAPDYIFNDLENLLLNSNGNL